jgi:Protein of unknown function (DUF3572)
MTPRKPQGTARDENAEAMAIEALGWLAGEPERLGRFIALSGLGPDNLRDAASAPGFLAAILDYLGSNESLLVAFSEESGRRPQDVARAAQALGAPSVSEP